MTTLQPSTLYPYKPKQQIIFNTKKPYGIQWNQQIIVSDFNNYDILFFDPKTLDYYSMYATSKRQKHLKQPTGLCVQPFTGYLLVCNAWWNRIKVLASDYSFLYEIDYAGPHRIGQDIDDVRGICCDNKGHILVTDTSNHRIQEFNESGRFLHLFGSYGKSSDQFIFPLGLCYDKPHRQLLVVDCCNDRVSIWSHDTCSKPQCISQIQLKDNCYSVCVDTVRNHQILIGTGCNVLVYDSRNHKEPIQTLGTSERGSKLGEFNWVSGICVNEQDGTLLVCDFNNHRIQLF